MVTQEMATRDRREGQVWLDRIESHVRSLEKNSSGFIPTSGCRTPVTPRTFERLNLKHLLFREISPAAGRPHTMRRVDEGSAVWFVRKTKDERSTPFKDKDERTSNKLNNAPDQTSEQLRSNYGATTSKQDEKHFCLRKDNNKGCKLDMKKRQEIVGRDEGGSNRNIASFNRKESQLLEAVAKRLEQLQKTHPPIATKENRYHSQEKLYEENLSESNSEVNVGSLLERIKIAEKAIKNLQDKGRSWRQTENLFGEDETKIRESYQQLEGESGNKKVTEELVRNTIEKEEGGKSLKKVREDSVWNPSFKFDCDSDNRQKQQLLKARQFNSTTGDYSENTTTWEKEGKGHYNAPTSCKDLHVNGELWVNHESHKYDNCQEENRRKTSNACKLFLAAGEFMCQTEISNFNDNFVAMKKIEETHELSELAKNTLEENIQIISRPQNQDAYRLEYMQTYLPRLNATIQMKEEFPQILEHSENTGRTRETFQEGKSNSHQQQRVDLLAFEYDVITYTRGGHCKRQYANGSGDASGMETKNN